MAYFKRLYPLALCLAVLSLAQPAEADEVVTPSSAAESAFQESDTAPLDEASAGQSGKGAKQHIEQLDQKLQQLFSKIKTLQEEREQLEAMIEAKEDQLEALQEEVVVVLKQRDFYEQELGTPENEGDAPFQP